MEIMIIERTKGIMPSKVLGKRIFFTIAFAPISLSPAFASSSS